jgi:hypothetical protein
MYFPYLRGKQFEMEALLGVPMAVYQNTLPIVEPVNTSSDRFYLRMAQQGRPLALIMNPQHPQRGRMAISVVQAGLVNGPLRTHTSLTLGFIIDQNSSLTDLQTFLTSNPSNSKIVIFRYNPIPALLANISSIISSHPVTYLVFDDNKTSSRTRGAFSWHHSLVLITDGFQRQERNSDYPPFSFFDSNALNYRADGFVGIGDYLSIGDHFQDGGSLPKVVTLHYTIPTSSGIEMHHFSSTVNASVQGLVGPKFGEACAALVSSMSVASALTSSGTLKYQDWDARNHNPRLGEAKQASLQHHIEVLSNLV